MTSASAFHFESLVWDWPIAIYLFLIGISAGLVTLAILLRRFHPEAGGSDSTLLRTTLGAKKLGHRVNIEIDPQTQAVVDTVERVLAAKEAAIIKTAAEEE